VAECARILGIETHVIDIHDGELTPSLENRKAMARLIREWQADIVMGHRPYDYHPDHRYTGVLMDDSAVVVVAPFFVPDTPPTRRNPVFMYYSDGFQDPKPFTPTMVVGTTLRTEMRVAMPSHRRRLLAGRTPERRRRPRRAYLLDIVKKRNDRRRRSVSGRPSADTGARKWSSMPRHSARPVWTSVSWTN
jgi:hypothetical protein